jgi:hypothetical protein
MLSTIKASINKGAIISPAAIAIFNRGSIRIRIYVAIDGSITPGIGIPPKIIEVGQIATFILETYGDFHCHVWGYDDEASTWKPLWSGQLHATEACEGFIWNNIRVQPL